MQHWNYSLPVAAGASVQVLVTAVSAWIEARCPPPVLSRWPGLVTSRSVPGVCFCSSEVGGASVQLRLMPQVARLSIGRARLQAPYTANLTLQLPSGTNLNVPVKGTYRGSSYSPVVRPRHPAAALVCLHLVFCGKEVVVSKAVCAHLCVRRRQVLGPVVLHYSMHACNNAPDLGLCWEINMQRVQCVQWCKRRAWCCRFQGLCLF